MQVWISERREYEYWPDGVSPDSWAKRLEAAVDAQEESIARAAGLRGTMWSAGGPYSDGTGPFETLMEMGAAANRLYRRTLGSRASRVRDDSTETV